MENHLDVVPAARVIAVLVVALVLLTAQAPLPPDHELPEPLRTAEASLPRTYSAKEIRATMVDAQTGYPLADVTVVARWVLRGLSGGTGPTLRTTEAVSDARGNVVIPGFPPLPRPRLMRLDKESPEILVFKSGFEQLRLLNASLKQARERVPNYRSMPTRELLKDLVFVDADSMAAVQESIWDGLTVELAPFHGTPDDWAATLSSLVDALDRMRGAGRRMLVAIRAEREYFRRHSASPQWRARLSGLFDRVDDLLQAEAAR